MNHNSNMEEEDSVSLRLNPAIFQLEERRKKKSTLAHELGEGSECRVCLEKCPGCQLHYWRKVCSNCRCGKLEHEVFDSEIGPGRFFVGKIFNLPLRSVKEELEFCYGKRLLSNEKDPNNNNDNNKSNKVTLDWIPPNVSADLAAKYLEGLPYAPISGSSGALLRKRQLQKQFPAHDIEPDKCHDLTKSEVASMNNYVDNVKKHNIGQGLVMEVQKADYGDDDDFPPPPPPLDSLTIDDKSVYNPPPPPPPPLMPKPNKSGTFYARPFFGSDGSVSSSTPGSSRNETPSPKSESLPPITGGACHCCEESLGSGDVVIRADRAEPGMLWHPTCFKCSVCDEMLVDLLYFYDQGRLYCGRDFSVIVSNIPRCGACDELIFATEYTGAENKVFHLRHFCCYECDRPLAGHKYISVDSQPHCFGCYQIRHGKKCKTCHDYISPTDQRLSLDDDHWHSTPECFRCAVCTTSLVGRKMTRKDGYILCSSACKQEIMRKTEAFIV